MGKQGPCYHCGVTSTPLWRNGPPEKPVLCNACGSRWRTKGTLANYTPLHSRAEPSDYEDHRIAKMKNISMNKGKEMKLLKRKHYTDNMMVATGGVGVDYNQGFQKIVDDDSSNRSSSGSAISNSDAQFCAADASDLTGPAQSVVWDTMVPSKKRTCVNRSKQSSVEKLTRDLHSILQEQQSSCFSGSSEEDLLFESGTPMVSIEIGHGTVLIRHPNAIAREEESEASSLSFDQRQYKINDAHSPVTPLSINSKSVGFPFPSPQLEKVTSSSSQDIAQERCKRDMTQQEKMENRLDDKDGLGLKELVKQLTDEEKQQVLTYKPAADTAKVPESLRSLLEKPGVKENLPCLQQLLTEGVFDECKQRPERSSVAASYATGPGFLISSRKAHDVMNPKFPDLKQMKSPKRVISKAEKKELLESDGSCISPHNIFAIPHDGGTLMLDTSPFVGESSDQDLLLNVPCSSSFPQAELLQSAPSLLSQQASTSSSSVYQHPGHP